MTLTEYRLTKVSFVYGVVGYLLQNLALRGLNNPTDDGLIRFSDVTGELFAESVANTDGMDCESWHQESGRSVGSIEEHV